jgi:hypothetical protein
LITVIIKMSDVYDAKIEELKLKIERMELEIQALQSLQTQKQNKLTEDEVRARHIAFMTPYWNDHDRERAEAGCDCGCAVLLNKDKKK